MNVLATPNENFNRNNKRMYEKLFTDYYRQIEWFCTSIIKDTVEAQDIAQDVFYKLWKERHKIDSEEHLKKILYPTARNLCMDYFRKKKSQQNLLRELVKFPNEEEYYFLIVQAEYLNILDEEVAQLPDRVREVFQLHYFKRLNNQQIAEQLNISINSVNVNKTMAKKMLTTALLKRDLYVLALFISLADQLKN